MMVNLATKFLPYVDEKFTTESKKSLLTNNDFDWMGAHTVKIYKVTTAPMNDYDRDGSKTGQTGSRYGVIKGLDATTQEMTLRKDRSFTFAVDALDVDETEQALAAANALERQLREVCIPEIDTYVYKNMIEGAGTTAAAKKLAADSIALDIMTANAVLDNAEVPETQRVLLVTPAVYLLMKQSKDIIMSTDIGQDMRLKGVISNLDGLTVIKVPASRVPAEFGFLLAHPIATVAPVKLDEYQIHNNPPGISGDLVEGRICYDAFVLDNKKMAIYYQPVTT